MTVACIAVIGAQVCADTVNRGELCIYAQVNILCFGDLPKCSVWQGCTRKNIGVYLSVSTRKFS